MWLATEYPAREFVQVKTYSRIGALSQLLELLEGTGVALVHGWDALTAAETADADGRVGSVVERESADVGGLQPLIARGAVGVAWVPENRTGRRQLAGNVER